MAHAVMFTLAVLAPLNFQYGGVAPHVYPLTIMYSGISMKHSKQYDEDSASRAAHVHRLSENQYEGYCV